MYDIVLKTQYRCIEFKGGHIMASSVVQFRIDDDLKDQAAEIFDKLGLDLSTAIRIFLKGTSTNPV